MPCDTYLDMSCLYWATVHKHLCDQKGLQWTKRSLNCEKFHCCPVLPLQVCGTVRMSFLYWATVYKLMCNGRVLHRRKRSLKSEIYLRLGYNCCSLCMIEILRDKKYECSGYLLSSSDVLENLVYNSETLRYCYYSTHTVHSCT